MLTQKQSDTSTKLLGSFDHNRVGDSKAFIISEVLTSSRKFVKSIWPENELRG